MKNRTLHKAFPIVAAAIGNRFGIKVSVGGDQAYTDGQSIQLPAYDGDDPDYQDFAWGLLAHESAHIRYSDFTLHYGGSVLRRRLCGAIEDVRIEHELAKDFPGTRLTLRTVVEKMIANGGFTASSSDDHPANTLYGYVLKSLRARVLGQVALNPLVALSETALKAHFPKGAVIRLKGLLSEVPEGLQSESDCLQLADRILTMIQQECEQEQQRNHSSRSDESSHSGQDENSAQSSQGNRADDSHAEGEDETDSDPAISDQESPGDDSTHPRKAASSPPQDNDGDCGISETNPMLESLFNAGDGDIDPDIFDTVKSALALAQDSVSEVILPIGDKPTLDEQAGLDLFRKVQGESVKIRAALQGLVQSQSLTRPQPGTRGRLDGRRLHRVCFGETKVFQRSAVKPSPNTAIHLLLDKSDSMGYQVNDTRGHAMGTRLPMALEATLALALAFEGLSGVNPSITAFPGDQEGSVYRLLDHSQRIRQRAGAFSLLANGGTPMTEAIWFGAAALLRCREPRKVLMVMTDGQPDDMVSTLAILQRCRDSGIETVGIGLGIDVSHLFPIAITINGLQELRTQLFELSKSLLLAA
ncbi:MAG: VWA domain-containing protein [Methylovulum miyakonense]|uniref:VWA domain-containing protein n=1 Tax=Methylovulum miyakonense TaxID=645578 RepID=UPI003BB5CF3A